MSITGIASNTIEALKGSPMLLVLILLNAAFVGAGVYYLGNQQEALERLLGVMLNRCLPDVHGHAYIAPPGGIPEILTPKGLEPFPAQPPHPIPFPP